MKLFKVITGLVIMLIVSSVQATTLKLSADIDLLVLDGHKISGSLLKGADGLELERGEHQLLFRVEKSFHIPAHSPVTWISAPQIVTFTARSRSVLIQLPPLASVREVRMFDRKPQFTLVDEKGGEIANKRDFLTVTTSGDFEQAMIHYNLNGENASVPRFAQPGKHTALSAAQEQDLALDRRSPAERMLHLWYQQVDAATRQRFITLMKALHTS
ncbi:DUF2057 family protein [Pantoea coffeiphila]|uniref:Uncharacterized protein n=1 Tax=Pantoea coffeiphila TaxID=1465635 RepID=A0A2S9IA57_9GAMM|nr:DUF2057 family protein [Pantoea coffeiphila]PRD14677.1 hypothetical protein CQW29_14295 [Pantoea coffeiphila]